MQLIQRLEKLDAIIHSANSDFQNQAKQIRHTSGLKPLNEFKEAYAMVSDANKTLAIGIIGRVKAGKSSLLNALLFEGKDILPKAATPMTAALTIMEYSEEIKAVAEFYTQKDLDAIRAGAANIPALKSQLITSHIAKLKEAGKVKPEKINDMAERSALRELKDHPDYALWEQSEQIGNRSLPSENEAVINADSVEALMGRLKEYVGADGKYMSFTKAVKLYLPFESLKGLQIIDTPGVNDPIVSRSIRTEQELSRCDVVFVVSPSGQFMSAEDIGLLSKVTQGEGIGEAYLVASQADSQLIGISDKYQSAVSAYQFLARELKEQAKATLSKEKEQLHNVIERFEKHDVICSSSVAYVMNKYFHDRSQWDENTQLCWDNLSSCYPADFTPQTAQATLQQLANIDKVQAIIEEVKPKREQILQAKLGELSKGQETLLANFVKKLTAYLDEKIEQLESTDIAQAEQRVRELEQSKKAGESRINSEFQAIAKDLQTQLRRPLKNTLNRAIRGIDAESKQGTETETKTESYQVKVGERSTSKWYNPFSWGDTESVYETRYRDYTVSHQVVYASQIKSEIKQGLNDISDKLEAAAEELINEWKDNSKRMIRRLVREIVGEDNIEIRQIERVVEQVFRNLPIADFYLNTNLPSSLEKSGTIRMDNGGREFLESAMEYVKGFEERAEREINTYLSNFDSLIDTSIAKDLFGKIEQEAKQLQVDIQVKETRIKEWNGLKADLAKI